MFDYGTRLHRLQKALGHRAIDAAVLSVGSDLPYIAGYQAKPTERLTALVVPQTGEATLFIPDLEVARVKQGPFRIRSWGEQENPIQLVAAILGEARSVAIGDHMWSVFLIDLQKALPAVQWVAASGVTRDLRIRKTTEELEALRLAAAAVDRVLARIPDEVRFSGRHEADVAQDIARMTVEEGCDRALFWIVASGPNSASPHHEPGDRIIERGDLVVCDFGGSVSGYHSDVTRTFVVGEPNESQVLVHSVVLAASEAAREAVAPGVAAEVVDIAARRVIEGAGYGDQFIHRTGHGIGMEVHEHPYIVEGNHEPLDVGMTFSIEPGIYLEGRFGVRIEDIVVVCPDGVGLLNEADRGLNRVN